MTTMTKQDIIDYFKEKSRHAESAMYEDWDQPKNWDNVASKVVDSYGGEDCGSTYYTVYEFRIDNGNEGETFYLRFNGWYASHYGTDYQDFREVRPKQVTRTEYV